MGKAHYIAFDDDAPFSEIVQKIVSELNLIFNENQFVFDFDLNIGIVRKPLGKKRAVLRFVKTYTMEGNDSIKIFVLGRERKEKVSMRKYKGYLGQNCPLKRISIKTLINAIKKTLK